MDGRTTPALKRNGGLPLSVPTPDNPDVSWLMERSTRKNERALPALASEMANGPHFPQNTIR